MNNYFKAETKFGNLMAGLIGGLAYYFYPNYNFFTLAMTIFISVCGSLSTRTDRTHD